MFFPWLLNTGEFTIEQDVAVEKYAILSHRWDNDEIKFNTLKPGDLQRSKKISGACRLARDLGFKYLWIDSVCMDKSNAVETSTNINSMFDYYHEAEMCLTYLSDVDSTKPRSKRFGRYEQPSENSVWFTRGWTLQELLASPNMRFYDKEWKMIGDKQDKQVKEDLASATKVNTRYLDGNLTFRSASVATRMSWMAGRSTTRVEDIAYSMLGILDVTMDPQYGEGVKAYLRLQKMLLTGPRDESIFAWTTCDDGLRCFLPPSSKIPWEPSSWGLLAPSPDCFRNSGNVIVPAREHREDRDYGWVQDAVQFRVPLKAGTDTTNWLGLPRKEVKFALNCWIDDGSKKQPTVVIHLTSRDGNNYVRVKCDTLSPTPGAKPSGNRVFGIDQPIRRPLTVGQPPFTLSRTGQSSVENPYADAPRKGSRLRTTNMALASELSAAAQRGS